MTLYDSGGGRVVLRRKLGSGGEADVYAVQKRPGVAAKIYKRPAAGQEAKLRAMLANPPWDGRSSSHRSLCWPTDIVRGPAGFVGVLMPRLDLQRMREVALVYNPGRRLAVAPAFSWRYLLQTATNVAATVESLHAKGYVVGDVNDRNVLVSGDSRITFVDCDSMQVRDAASGALYRSPVGTPAFCPPELMGRDLRGIDRHPHHDAFGLAVLIFLLLMEGNHPFAGLWQLPTPAPSIEDNIVQGRFPYGANTSLGPRPTAPPFEILPAPLQQLFRRCFVDGHASAAARPAAATWRLALEQVALNLVCCGNPAHLYGRHLTTCPWCQRTAQLGGVDPFPPPPPPARPPSMPILPFPVPGAISFPVRQPPLTARGRSALSRAVRDLVRVAAVLLLVAWSLAAMGRLARASITMLSSEAAPTKVVRSFPPAARPLPPTKPASGHWMRPTSPIRRFAGMLGNPIEASLGLLANWRDDVREAWVGAAAQDAPRPVAVRRPEVVQPRRRAVVESTPHPPPTAPSAPPPMLATEPVEPHAEAAPPAPPTPRKVGKKWGFVDAEGRWVIPQRFDSAHDFSEGLAPVRIGKWHGFIDPNGAVALPLKYRYAMPFATGRARVHDGKRWVEIDRTGRTHPE